MFWHIFKYRMIAIARDKNVMFWTLAFPVILGSFFGLAFSNISNVTSFDTVHIGIITTAEFEADTNLSDVLQSEKSGEKDLFDITLYDTQADAKKALDDQEISGFIVEEDDITVYVASTGINQTILKSVLDWYIQTTSAVENIIQNDPSTAATVQKILENNVTYITEAKTDTNEPDDMLTYYYALIAMTCLYGAFLGLKEVQCVQANQSTHAARQNLAPVNKLKVFASSLCAAMVIQYISILILIAYLRFALGISFGGQIGFILLGAFASSCAGLSMGAMIGAAIKASEGKKIAIIIGFSMLMSFLAGLMVSSMKYLSVKYFPPIAYLNPANLISDAFYSLYYYNTYDRFFLNVTLLFTYSLVFYLITYVIMRRQNYANL